MEVQPLLGIFVGGQSRRMGVPKGLLRIPGSSEPVVEGLVRRGIEAGFDPVLVGEASPYARLVPEVLRLEDDPVGAGPLGGLRAVVRYALQTGRSHAITIACDMPFVSTEALAMLRDHPSTAAVLAPRLGSDAPWEPMLARYHASELVPVLDEHIAGGSRSFQALFALVEVEALPVTPDVERALRDWDTPEDLPR